MTKLSSTFRAIDKWTMLAAEIAASLFMGVAVSAGFWQVLSRFVFANPSVWSEALVRLSLTWMVMLGLALALRHNMLVSIDAVYAVLKSAFGRWVDALILAANLALVVMLGWLGFFVTQRVVSQNLAGLEISIAFGYAAIPVGCACAIIGSIGAFLHNEPFSEDAYDE